MSVRRLLLAVLVLGFLGGAVYWSNKAKTGEDSERPADAGPRLAAIPENQVKQLVWTRQDGTSITAQRASGNNWRITAPQALAADTEAITGVLSSLSALESERLIEEKSTNLAEFGLAQPAVKLAVTQQNGQTTTVLLGNETPTGGAFFAKLAADPRIVTINSSVKGNLDKTLGDVREKRLAAFQEDTLTRLSVQTKGPPLMFSKNAQGDWQTVQPQAYRADNSQVDTLLTAIRAARLDPARTEADAQQQEAQFRTATPVGTVAATDAAGNKQLEIRKVQDGTYLLASNTVPGVYKAEEDLAKAVEKPLEEYRTKKLFDFGFDEPTRVSVTGGTANITLDKSGENWQFGGKTMDTVAVQALLDKLRDLSASQFVQLGSASSSGVILTVVSRNGKRTEKVVATQQGGNYLARREGEPAFYEVSSASIDEILRAASNVKPKK